MNKRDIIISDGYPDGIKKLNARPLTDVEGINEMDCEALGFSGIITFDDLIGAQPEELADACEISNPRVCADWQAEALSLLEEMS